MKPRNPRKSIPRTLIGKLHCPNGHSKSARMISKRLYQIHIANARPI